MTRILGIDPSLTSTGVATILFAENVGRFVIVDRIRPKKLDGLDRIRAIRNALRVLARGTSLAVIEGPSYGSQGNQRGHHERAGLWWMVVDMLERGEIPYAVASPSARAKYATGKGNASKDAVLAAVIRRYPDVEVTSNDQADALVLAAMGARHLGLPIESSLPATHILATSAVDWPVEEVAS
jgi:crossover junction endodeoxyribonuclease RuvC